jgi:hypothetical protein
MKDKYKQEIINFITKNGWIEDKEIIPVDNDFFRTFNKENNISIDIDDDEIVLIGDNGDFCHIKINVLSIYALLGYMIQYHYIAIDYKW